MMIGTGLLQVFLALYIFSNKSILMYVPIPSGEQQD
jgi:hypothetical protein